MAVKALRLCGSGECVSGVHCGQMQRLLVLNLNWHSSGEKIGHTFGRQAIPMAWDYAEGKPVLLFFRQLDSHERLGLETIAKFVPAERGIEIHMMRKLYLTRKARSSLVILRTMTTSDMLTCRTSSSAG